jgi:CRISPR system Cascade subunit CasB
MNPTEQEDSFISYLLHLKNSENRGALAALRSGLGKEPGEAPRMFPYVGNFLYSTNPDSTSSIVIFSTASLFSLHPIHSPGRSLGMALWHATKSDKNPNGKHGQAGVEARLTATIDSHRDDLIRNLQGLVSLCESAGEGIDWSRFKSDLYSLLSDDDNRRDRTRLQWARDFWQGPRKTETTTNSEGTE